MSWRRLTPRSGAVWLFVAAIVFAWLTMLLAHELGHVLAGVLSGGAVTKVVLHPLAISRTDVDGSSMPRLVVWAGPLAGTLIPLLAWLALRFGRFRRAWLAAFVAGFCCIANGAYLGSALWRPVGDAEMLLRLGASRWLLGLFGIVACIAGFWLWNGLAPRFGFGAQADTPDERAAAWLTVASVLIAVAEAALSERM